MTSAVKVADEFIVKAMSGTVTTSLHYLNIKNQNCWYDVCMYHIRIVSYCKVVVGLLMESSCHHCEIVACLGKIYSHFRFSSSKFKSLLSDVTNNYHCFLSNSSAVVTGHSYFCVFCFKGTMLGFDDKLRVYRTAYEFHLMTSLK